MQENLMISVACAVALAYTGLRVARAFTTERQSNLTGEQPTWWGTEAHKMTPIAVKFRWGLIPSTFARALQLAGVRGVHTQLKWTELCMIPEHKFVVHAVEYMVHGK